MASNESSPNTPISNRLPQARTTSDNALPSSTALVEQPTTDDTSQADAGSLAASMQPVTIFVSPYAFVAPSPPFSPGPMRGGLRRTPGPPNSSISPSSGSPPTSIVLSRYIDLGPPNREPAGMMGLSSSSTTTTSVSSIAASGATGAIETREERTGLTENHDHDAGPATMGVEADASGKKANGKGKAKMDATGKHEDPDEHEDVIALRTVERKVAKIEKGLKIICTELHKLCNALDMGESDDSDS